VEMGEGDLHLLDLVDGLAQLARDPIADARGVVAGGFDCLPAVEGGSPDHLTGLTIDHQAGAAEASHLLEPR
jgi:hypothetical protein